MSLLPIRNAPRPEGAEKQDTKRRALGRGLEVLLPKLHASTGDAAAAPSDGRPLELSVEQIDRNPLQTRTSFDPQRLQELARSIAANGVVQPILVRSFGGGRYQLITGERRLIASKQAGKTTIPAIVRHVSDEQSMEMTIIENLQREDLNPMEQARAFHRLAHDFKMTQEQVATRTGKDRASIGNFLRLLKLPEPVQQKVEDGTLSFGHARTLLALESPEQILAATQKVVALSMSVRQTESFVQGLLNPESRDAARQQKVIEPLDPNVVEARDRLQRSLGLRVKIEDRHGKGRVIIEYSDLEDFDTLLLMLKAYPND